VVYTIPIVFLCASIATYIRLLRFHRASVQGPYRPSDAVADIFAEHLVHLVTIGIIVGVVHATLRFANAPAPSPPPARVLRWASVGHVPFAIWALATLALLWPLTSGPVTAASLDGVMSAIQQRVMVRPFIWIAFLAILVWQARRDLSMPLARCVAQVVGPVVGLWLLVELAARVLE
jgi:hypothetical protein